MKRLERAIEQQDWELAAHLLALGLVRTIEKLPPEAVEATLELLAAEEEAHPHRRRDRTVRRRRGGDR